jgi:hypothetical protein
VLDDRVALVAVMHADAEEAVEFPVRHAPERARGKVAMRLRRLDYGDAGIAEVRDEPAQPLRVHPQSASTTPMASARIAPSAG